ncbi:MAG: hypothetical protein IJX30_01680 [Clostridia bacterium]|nr:hypothetical protein [Clostridia bacterium]
MKKTTLAKLLGLSCAVCLVGGAASIGNVNTVSANEATTLVADAEWVDAWNQGAKVQYDTATGVSSFNIVSWGQRAYNENKVKLDGLTVTLGSTKHIANTRLGFGFASAEGKYTLNEETTVNVTWVPFQYNGQNRLYVNSNHADGSICYVDQELTNNNEGKPFGLDKSFVATATTDDAYSFTFDLVSEGVWSVTVDVVRGQAFETQTTPCTVYFSEASMPGILDENGECYLSAWGMSSAGEFTISYEDDNLRAYKASHLEAAAGAASAYIEAASAASDADSFSAAMEKRTALEAAIANLRDNDKIVYNAKLAEGDAAIAGAQDSVKATIQAEYDKVEAAVAVLAEDAGVSADNIAAAKTTLEAANAVYANMSGMLNDENKTYFTSLADGYAYTLNLATARLWVIGWENDVAALASLTDADLVDAIVEGKATRAAYAGSEAANLIANVLTEDDKAALEARITAADEAFAAVEEANLAAVKDSYLTVVESKITDVDLTLKANIDEAKKAYANLLAKVEIVEADGELYTRLTAAYTAIKDACEAYVIAEMDAVIALLDAKYSALSAFKPVRDRWNAIDLAYLMEENAEIAAKYAEGQSAIEQNDFYYINTTGDRVSDVTQTATGLYFSEYGTHPQRLNYNKELDLEEGVTVTVCLEEAAFINTDMKAANNLCFNFLANADSYKSMSNGFTVMIWLFGGESSVKIYTRTSEDVAVASFSIPTPIDGSNLVIDVRYDANYYWIVEDATMPAYVVNINDVAVSILADDILEDGETEAMTKAYFSMGSYMDKRENPNCYTLISINDVTFADESLAEPDGPTGDEPTTSDPTTSEPTTSEPTTSEPEEEKKGGCGGVVGASMVLCALAVVGGAVLLKKKED